MREVAKWAGIVWMVASLALTFVIMTIEMDERRPLILPMTGGLGEISLFSGVICIGFRLYFWGVRITP